MLEIHRICNNLPVSQETTKFINQSINNSITKYNYQLDHMISNLLCSANNETCWLNYSLLKFGLVQLQKSQYVATAHALDRKPITSVSAAIAYYRYVSHATEVHVNSLRPRQNGSHFADDIFKCIFLNESEWISFKISLKFVLKGPINNIPALVQIMAWRRPDDKPLSEPLVFILLTHICVTRPQWVN